MAKRVVLAYSGGLDTSVAVRWMIENYGVEVIALAVDVGQDGGAHRRGPRSATRAPAAGAVEAEVVDAQAPSSPPTSSCPRLQANALYEGRYPLVSAAVAARASCSTSSPRPRAHGADAVAPRVHRQGQRPGALRGVDPRPRRPISSVLAPVRRVGDDARGLHPLRLRARHPDHRDARRRCTRSTTTSGAEPSSAARWRTPWRASPPPGRVVADEADRDRARGPRRSPSTSGVPVAVDGEALRRSCR